MTQYIGITDLETEEQVRRCIGVMERHRTEKTANMKLMVGVMMSYKTLMDQPSKWTDVWIKKEDMSNVFIDHPTVYNTLHYADYEHHNLSSASDDLIDCLEKALEYCGNNVHAIQLDMVWPCRKQIKVFRQLYRQRTGRKIDIILQVGRKAFEYCEHDLKQLAKKIDDYCPHISHILFDMSGGEGVPLDVSFTLECLGYLNENCFGRTGIFSSSEPQLQFSVAGGLCHETVDSIKPIVNQCSEVSIDAQGRIHKNCNNKSPLSITRAEKYIVSAMQVFNENK